MAHMYLFGNPEETCPIILGAVLLSGAVALGLSANASVPAQERGIGIAGRPGPRLISSALVHMDIVSLWICEVT